MRKSHQHLTRSHLAMSQPRKLMIEALESRLCMAAVPAMESLPGANHTVYLDFDGHVVENTNWNSYYNQTMLVAQPYNIDSDPSTFSATELSRIQEAFDRVAEDFRPFNINVTTIEPALDRLQKSPNSDTRWGVRVIMTTESTMVNDSTKYCGCGGIAYINSFNSSIDLPVWVYTTGGKSIAEAASHEVGHALGLSHDGTPTSSYYTGHGSGDVGWAPIMGVGYYQNVTQWDDGTYYNSNNTGSGANYGKGADDLAVITTYNGFGYRVDDRGNTNATASPLSISGTTVNDAGVIERSSDVDVYAFTTGAGPISLNINSFTPGPNLDLQADLYNSSNNLVASSNPASGLNASLSLTLPAGQYYLHIRGVGVGSPTVSSPSGYSNYASLGSYRILGSIVDPGLVAQLTVNDVTVNESAGTATFTVTLSGNPSGDVSVNFVTVNQTAIAPDDYTATSGNLVFVNGGVKSLTVTVDIKEDPWVEGEETFELNLSGAVGALIADGQGIGTIVDNDASLSITDASATEGNAAKGKKNSGSPNYKDFVFVVSLSNVVINNVTVQWATANGTATLANNDYVAASGSLMIPAGQSSASLVVRVIGDDTGEPDETFFVNLSAPEGAIISGAQGVGTILDDDSSGGGGKGRGNSGKGSSELLLVVDELWYFEPPGESHHDQVHERSALVAYSPSLSGRESLGMFRWQNHDERAVLSTEAIDDVMNWLVSAASDNGHAAKFVRVDSSECVDSESADDASSVSQGDRDLQLKISMV